MVRARYFAAAFLMVVLLSGANAYAAVTLTAADVVEASAAKGSTVTFNYTFNVTGTPANNALASIRFSNDATCNNSDIQVKTWAYANNGNTTPLSLGAHNYTVTFAIPGGAIAGSTGYVCALPSGTTTSPISAPVDVTAPATPVVAVSAASVTPGTADQGAAVQVDFTLTVSGAPAPAASTIIRYSADSTCSAGSPDIQIKTVSYSTPAPGNSTVNTTPLSVGPHNYSVSANIPGNAAVGTGYICVMAGGSSMSDTVIVESSSPSLEPDDAVVVAPIADGPDGNSNDEVVQSGTVQLSYDLVYENSPVNGSASIRLDDNQTCSTGDPLVGTVAYSGLSGDGTSSVGPLNVLIPMSTPIGTNRRLCVFAGGNVTASGLFDIVEYASDVYPANVKTFGPETTVEDELSEDPPYPHIAPGTVLNNSAGDTILADPLRVTFQVHNQGTAPAGAAFAELRLDVGEVGVCTTDDFFLQLVNTPAVAVQSYETVVVDGIILPTVNPEDAAFRICVRVDVNNASGQTAAGHGNDWASGILVIGPNTPDLVPVVIETVPSYYDSSRISSQSVVSSEYVSSYEYGAFNVYNQGRGTAAASHVRAYLSDFGSLEDHDLGTEGDQELEVTPPCIAEAAIGIRSEASALDPACVDELESGEWSCDFETETFYVGPGFSSFQPDRTGDGCYPWGQFNSNVVSLYGGDSFGITAQQTDGSADGCGLSSVAYDYGVVTFRPGRFLWVVADSEGEVDEIADISEANNYQRIFVPSEEITFADLSYLTAYFYSYQGGIGGGGPRLEVEFTDGDWLRVHFGAPGSFVCADSYCSDNSYQGGSGFNLIGANDLGRYETQGVGGSHYSDYPTALSLAGDKVISAIHFVVDTYNGAPGGSVKQIELSEIYINTNAP